METEQMSIFEQLDQLRITSRSEIPPHDFLYTWNGVPCFARGELVAVTGKAKSGKTYLNSILMAAAGTSALSRGAGNELEPAYNAGRMDGGNIFYNASRNFLTRIPKTVSTAYVPL